MARLKRPLNKETVKEATDKLYALHARDPRPNALYDARGKRLRLDFADPAQAGLRKQWRDLYCAALPKEKPASPARPPLPPPRDRPVGRAVETCPPEEHWIKTQLTRLPDQKTRPDWWPKKPDRLPYPYEPFMAEITDGDKADALDGEGFSEYKPIPAGICSWTFALFFKSVENLLEPHAQEKDAESLPEPLKPHWIKTQLVRLPDQKQRPDWWPKQASGLPYPDEPFTAKLTGGDKAGSLDSRGFSECFDHIPAGSYSWTFTGFFKEIESLLEPRAQEKDAESLSEP